MGVLLSLCTMLLGAIALAIWARGSAAQGTGHRRAVALLGGIGIVALALSAISTYDDDFQRECIAGRTSFRVSGRGLARVSADGILSHKAVALGPVAKPHLPRPEGITGPLCIATISFPGRPPSEAFASRAPPLPL